MDQNIYEDIATVEETHWWHLGKRKLVRQMLEQFSEQQQQMLDVGCGAGGIVDMLRHYAPTVGLDSSEDALAHCRKRGLGEHCRLMQDDTLPVASDVFSVVTLLDVLEHTDDVALLREAFRVLHRRGIAIINVPAYPWLWSRWDEVLHHRRRYTRTSLHRVVSEAGLTIEKISYHCSFLVIPLYLVHRWKERRYRGRPYPSDNSIQGPFLQLIGTALTASERKFIKVGWLPFGSSIVCVARKI